MEDGRWSWNACFTVLNYFFKDLKTLFKIYIFLLDTILMDNIKYDKRKQ